MHRIDRVGMMNIYSNGKGYIVHNTRKSFAVGHTHINNYNTARYIAMMANYKKIPKKYHLSKYLKESLIRLSIDAEYIRKIEKINT